MHRRFLIILPALALSLAACDNKPDPITWMNAPHDPEVRALVFDRCLEQSRGPQRTHYNDQAETVEECDGTAERISRYCPIKRDCAPDLPSLLQVRGVLPKEGDSE